MLQLDVGEYEKSATGVCEWTRNGLRSNPIKVRLKITDRLFMEQRERFGTAKDDRVCFEKNTWRHVKIYVAPRILMN